MAKKARSRKRRATFGQAKKALATAGVPAAEFGRHNRDGTIKIDHKKLEALQKRLGRTRQKHVRFVALNAPFKRRLPVSPT
jgi:hypothetical protein